MSLTLILGGTRSGKSAHAERLAAASGLRVRYIGTAAEESGSMTDRIARHQARRPAAWETVTASDELAASIDRSVVTLIDGLGVWIAGRSRDLVEHQIGLLIDIATGAQVIVVAELAGEGLLPLDRIARDWLDLLGEQVERLSAAASVVHQVVAGRVIELPAAAGSVAPGNEVAPALSELRHHGDRDVRPGDRDHAVNVLADGPPGWLRDSLRAALDEAVQRYPAEDDAITATADRHRRDAGEVVVTNGAAEALWLLAPALRPRHAAILHPAFTESEAALRAYGAPVSHVLRDPEADFALSVDAVPTSADLVIVGNPASPDGTLYSPDQIYSLRAPGRTVVVDEAFMSIVPGEPGSLAALALPDVIVVRSLTKLLSVPGLRVGYALAPPELAARMRAVRPPWSANALSLAALVSVAEHRDQSAQLAVHAAEEAADLRSRLSGVADVTVWPSATNFCLVRIADGADVARTLKERGIAVRPAGTFPGLDDDFIRVTARAPADNERLAGELQQILRERTE